MWSSTETESFEINPSGQYVGIEGVGYMKKWRWCWIWSKWRFTTLPLCVFTGNTGHATVRVLVGLSGCVWHSFLGSGSLFMIVSHVQEISIIVCLFLLHLNYLDCRFYTPYLSMGFAREQLPTNSTNARKISTGVPVVATMSVPRMLTCVLFCTGFQEFLLRRCPDSIELCWVRESTHVTEVWKEVFHMKTSE